MAKYLHADVLDGGLNVIDTAAIRLLLLKAYSAADSFATVASNTICSITVSGSDFSIAGVDGAARVLTAIAKSGTASASSGATPDLHIALTDNVSRVLAVTDETSDQVVTSGNTVNVPSFTISLAQPT